MSSRGAKGGGGPQARGILFPQEGGYSSEVPEGDLIMVKVWATENGVQFLDEFVDSVSVERFCFFVSKFPNCEILIFAETDEGEGWKLE
jgi:hypothetical protein